MARPSCCAVWRSPWTARSAAAVAGRSAISAAVRSSLNGADIAYASLDGLSVAAADGSRARQVVPQDPDDTRFWWYGAEWSPAGGQIAFVNQPGGESSDGGHVNELTLVDVASGTLVPLADTGGGVHEYSSTITFSPEGDQILFSRIDATV